MVEGKQEKTRRSIFRLLGQPIHRSVLFLSSSKNMSATVEKTATDKKPSNRRRRPNSQGERGPRKAPAEAAAPKAAATEAAPRETTSRPPRPPAVPVPEDLQGKTVVGVVSTLVRRGKFNFGFITIGEGESAPSIYFNPSGLVDPKLYLRRGYEVELLVTKDEEGRATAKDIKLTPKGEQAKAENDAVFEAKRKERAAAPPAAAEGAVETEKKSKPRTRKPRPPVQEGEAISFVVTSQDSNEQKTVETHTLVSLGKLKTVAAKLFDAPLSYQIFLLDNGKKVRLDKELFSGLKSGDKIHLAAAEETA